MSMTHLKTFIFLTLLCVLSGAQQSMKRSDFDVTRILGDPWYSLVWFNNRPDSKTYGCNSYQFTQTSDPNRIAYEYSYNYPDSNGTAYTGIYSLVPTDNSRVFDVIYSSVPRQLSILAYDEENYNWIVIGDSTTGGDPWVDLLVRSVDNEDDNAAGMTRVEQEAAKYGRQARHDVKQSSACPYDANRAKLLVQKAAKEEQAKQNQLFKPATGFDVKRILDGRWYQLFRYNDLAIPWTVACNSFQLTQSSDPNKISYEYSYNVPILRGYLIDLDTSLTPTDVSRVFDVENPIARTFNILAYDEEDYSWIVTGDTGPKGKPWVNILVRSVDGDNADGVRRLQEVADKYGLETRHAYAQGDFCPYTGNNDDQFFEKEGQSEPASDFDVERILDGPWYEIAFFNNFEDDTSIGCSFFLFSQSLDSNDISYDHGYKWIGGNHADSYQDNYVITSTDSSDVFEVLVPGARDDPTDRQLKILDYDDEDYSWIVTGDTGSQGIPWVSVMVRALDNESKEDLISRAAEEAAKYGLKAKHDVIHNNDCTYGENIDV